ncbi:MAG: helix-turn-helix domain-containing protein [Altererythrobacter sp.]|nr:helix-turn-helix domain-containing protein [Altererythrobacter sp.]
MGSHLMVEEMDIEPENELPLEGVGRQLRRAREAKGMTLAQVAADTRIAERHLQLIEQDQFSELPARTYAFGFSRTYARALGLDEAEIVASLRAELDNRDEERPRYTPAFEPGDPAKAPPSGVVWASAIAVLLLAAGSYAFYARFMAPGADPAPLVAKESNETGASMAAQSEAQSVSGGVATGVAPDQVVFTALEDGIWVSFYEAGGRRLEQKLMAMGESFAVPADAQDPRIWTGRPDAFAITIGGQEVEPLSEEQVTIRDVPIAADALRDRMVEAPEPAAIDSEAASEAPEEELT